MEERAVGDRAKSAARYVAADARYVARSRPPPQRPLVVPHAAVSLSHPHARVRGAPTSRARYDALDALEEEVASVPAVAGLEYDDDFQLDDELKMEFDRSARAHRRPHRMKYVKCKTRVQPELLVPYLYGGDRHSHSRISAIIDRTGCTIAYCPESPNDDVEEVPSQRSRGDYLMSFLVAAETSGQLDIASRLLLVLVNRVQQHVEEKVVGNGVQRESEMGTPPRGDQGGSPDRELPSYRVAERDQSQMNSVKARYLKPEPSGEQRTDFGRDEESSKRGATESWADSNERSHLDGHWIQEDEHVDIASPRLHQAHAYQHAQQRRSRQMGSRYHRPIYRRILVDEDGYEVYDRPPYEVVALPSHLSSPPIGRRRARERLLHPANSSDEESYIMRGSSAHMHQSRPTGIRGHAVVDAGISRSSLVNDVSDRSTRRGLKRRLEGYDFDDMYPRRRSVRRGSAVYDILSDDVDPDESLSNEEFGDQVYGVESLPGRPHQGMHWLPTMAKDDIHCGVSDVDMTRSSVAPSYCPQVLQVERDKYDSGGQSSPEHTKQQSQTAESIETQEPQDLSSSTDHHTEVATNVEIAFENDIGSTVGASEAWSESEIDDAVSVMPHGADGPLAQTAVRSMVEFNDDNHADETTKKDIADSSKAPDATTLQNLQTDMPKLRLDSEENADTEESRDPAECCEPVNPTIPERAGDHERNQSHHTASSPLQVANSTARTVLNAEMIDRLGSDTRLEHRVIQFQSRLLSAAKRVQALANQARPHLHLSGLVQVAQTIDGEIWRQQNLSQESKHALALKLDLAIQAASDANKSIAARVTALQSGLDEIVASELLRLVELDPSRQPIRHLIRHEATDDKAMTTDEASDANISSSASMGVTVSNVDELNDSTRESSDHRNFTAGTRDVKKNLLAHISTARLIIPNEAPSFVSGLVVELERTSCMSQVMASAQKRLLREISKIDPYYYLHPTVVDSNRKDRRKSCLFGCAGVSAHKWERKVVSQISSRMKWFDSVAYSLAKVSGGKEMLSRKKMNSTIRKLHLVALQLHCLIAHLLCIRKRVVCREIDSLPTALNNSYYEKRMNGYKSRLKLALHQQRMPSFAGSTLLTEELVRDSFEFYPELLLAVDVWGYDYRHSDGFAPVDMLEVAAKQSFDFDNDTNGLLQGICEELLSILCRWNDFKWGESLESLSVADIVNFETKVKTSIRKILEAHASHLLSQWSYQLCKAPIMLRHIRLTQSNVYYTEQLVNMYATKESRSVDQTQMSLRHDEGDEDDSHGEQKDEDAVMLRDVWGTRFESQFDMPTSSTEPKTEGGEKSSAPLDLAPLRVEDLVTANDANKSERVLSWSEVYDLRQRCHMLADQAAHMAPEEQPDSQPLPSCTSGCDVFDLLTRLARARSVVEDAIRTSEKLAVHSMNHQHDGTDSGDCEAGQAEGSLADVESMSDGSRDGDDAMVDALLAVPTGKATDCKHQDNDSDNTPARTDEGNDQSDENAWKQPMMKDLVEIVTSTNQEMTEIGGQRARSARVRDKLQSQSLELARQSIQIFQTILNMKP